MGANYQEHDWDVVKYDLYYLEDFYRPLRGPRPPSLESGAYFTSIGAAQTFGRFVARPFPLLLAERLGAGSLNLGTAGAGPRFFVEHPELLRYANAGAFAIIQVMSARSEDNSLFSSGGRELLTRRGDGVTVGAEPAYQGLLAVHPAEYVRHVVEETRRNWLASFRALLATIRVPRVVLWFSERDPDYQERYDDVYTLFGKFPQLVNSRMLEEVRARADHYVECISSRGMPQLLRSRFTGLPSGTVVGRADLGWDTSGYNRYYPSPEMHEDAAEALQDVCGRLWAARR
jgi:hypothetical protein